MTSSRTRFRRAVGVPLHDAGRRFRRRRRHRLLVLRHGRARRRPAAVGHVQFPHGADGRHRRQADHEEMGWSMPKGSTSRTASPPSASSATIASSQFKIDPGNMKAAFARPRFPGAGQRAAPEPRLRDGDARQSQRPARRRAGRGLGKEPRQGRATSSPRSSRARTRASSRSSAAATSTSPTAPSCRTATCCCWSAPSRWRKA